MNNSIPVKVALDLTDMDEVERKLERIVALMKEAKSLADDLASLDIMVGLRLDVQV